MAQVKFHKFVAALPAELEANAIYYVRAGAGFDIYVTNSSGTVVAYPLNVGGAGQGFFRTEPIAATATGQTVFTVPGGYTPGAIIVSLNGASLPPADYTATDGATVVLASGDGIVAGSVLLVHVLSAFEVANALPLGGTAADSSLLGGFPPEYYIGGGSWGSITGTLADQADLASALNSKAAASDIDFTIIYPNGGSAASPANVVANSRYVLPNPFPGHFVVCSPEVLRGGEWGRPGFIYNGGGVGVVADQLSGGSVIVQTGSLGLNTSAAASGGSIFSGEIAVGLAPCRVKVWKVKGAIA